MDIRSLNDVRKSLEKLIQDIRDGHSKPAYLLYGDEEYLKRQYKNKFLRTMSSPEDTMNIHYFEGKKIDVEEVISIADTMPFFADYRTICITNSGWMKAQEDDDETKKKDKEKESPAKKMAEYLKHPPQTVRFLFYEQGVDKRTNLYKAIKDMGTDINFMGLDRDSITQWIAGMAAAEKKKISPATIDLLTQRTGFDMYMISNELEKVLSYTEGRNEITADDIRAVVSINLEDRIFPMMDAIVEKKQKRALQLYYEMLAQKVEPLHVLVMLARQFDNMMWAKGLRMEGYDSDGIAKKMELTPNKRFLADKYPRQASRFQMEDLKLILRECMRTEESVKSGLMDSRLAVEILIVKYSV